MSRILLENYKNAILSTAKKVIKIQGEYSELQAQLEAAGLSLEQEREENKHKGRLILEGRVLFKTLLELEQPLMQTCRELEACAKQYGKDKRIFPSLLEQWASDKNPKEMKKWYIAIAIDVLMQHDINPTTLLPAEQIAYYWAQNHIDPRPNKPLLTLSTYSQASMRQLMRYLRGFIKMLDCKWVYSLTGVKYEKVELLLSNTISHKIENYWMLLKRMSRPRLGVFIKYL